MLAYPLGVRSDVELTSGAPSVKHLWNNLADMYLLHESLWWKQRAEPEAA